MHAHLPRILADIGLCALPLLIWIPLRLWGDGDPQNEVSQDQDGGEAERDRAEIRLAA